MIPTASTRPLWGSEKPPEMTSWRETAGEHWNRSNISKRNDSNSYYEASLGLGDTARADILEAGAWILAIALGAHTHHDLANASSEMTAPSFTGGRSSGNLTGELGRRPAWSPCHRCWHRVSVAWFKARREPAGLAEPPAPQCCLPYRRCPSGSGSRAGSGSIGPAGASAASAAPSPAE